MRLIKFAGSLVEVQREAFVCGSHRVVGLQLLLCVHPRGNPSPAGVPWGTLFTHSTVWKSVRLQIRCSETNVITLTSTSRFLPSVFSHPEPVSSAGGKEGGTERSTASQTLSRSVQEGLLSKHTSPQITALKCNL